MVIAHRVDRPRFSAALQWSLDGGRTWQPTPPPGPTESSGDVDHGQFHTGLAGLQRDEELLARIAAWMGDGLGARTAAMR